MKVLAYDCNGTPQVFESAEEAVNWINAERIARGFPAATEGYYLPPVAPPKEDV